MEQYNQIVEALHLRNWYALAALVLLVAVQIVKTAPVLKPTWQAIPNGWRWLIPIVSGAVTGFTQAFAANLPFGAALLAAVGGAVGISIPAMGINAALTESKIPWNGGAGGAPLPAKKDSSSGVSNIGPGLVFVLCCGLAGFHTGCGLFASSSPLWPVVAKCMPSGSDLVQQVTAIFVEGGDIDSKLTDLAKTLGKDGKDFVICAAKEAVADLQSRVGATAARSAAAARGHEFLAKTGNDR